MQAADVLVMAAYGSLLIELTVFPIPSEASTLDLLTTRAAAASSDDALAAARRRSTPGKLLRFLLPTAVGVLLGLLPLAVIVRPDWRPHLFPVSLPTLLPIGLTLVVAGRLITFTSVLQLRAAKRKQALPRGWFRYSRNPGLVGMFVFYLGLCLAFGGPWLWLGAPLYFVNMHHRVRLEEADLAAVHGTSWRSYAAQVARYLPVRGLR